MSGKIGEKLRRAADLEEKTNRELQVKNTQSYIWIATILSKISDMMLKFLFSVEKPDTYGETMPYIFRSEKEIETAIKLQEEAQKPLYERDILTDTDLWD